MASGGVPAGTSVCEREAHILTYLGPSCRCLIGWVAEAKGLALEDRWPRLPFLPALTLAEACVPSQQKRPNIVCRNREGQDGRG